MRADGQYSSVIRNYARNAQKTLLSYILSCSAMVSHSGTNKNTHSKTQVAHAVCSSYFKSEKKRSFSYFLDISVFFRVSTEHMDSGNVAEMHRLWMQHTVYPNRHSD